MKLNPLTISILPFFYISSRKFYRQSIVVETECVKISVKSTYYFLIEIFCKNKVSVRKIAIFKRAKYVQDIKIRQKLRS